MLNKSNLKPLAEMFSLQRNEKSATYLQITMIAEDKIKFKMISLLATTFSYECSVEVGDVIDNNHGKTATIFFPDFEKGFKKLKAKNKLKIILDNDYIEIQQISNASDSVVETVSIKQSGDILIEDFIFRDFSEYASYEISDINHSSYMANFKMNLENMECFNGITLRQDKDTLYFLGTFGASLHCFKMATSENILADNDYIIPSVYMKNMKNLFSNNGYFRYAKAFNGEKHIDCIEFTDNNLTMIFPVKVISAENSVFSTPIFSKLLTMNPSNVMDFKDCLIDGKKIDTINDVAKLINASKITKEDTVVEFNIDDTIAITSFDEQPLAHVAVCNIYFDKDTFDNNLHKVINAYDFITFLSSTEETTKIMYTFENDVFILMNGHKYLYVPLNEIER